MIKLNFTKQDIKKATGTVVVFTGKKGKFSDEATQLDKACKGGLKIAVDNSRFSGEAGEVVIASGVAANEVRQVLLVSLGDVAKMQHADWRKAGALVGRKLDEMGVAEAATLFGAPKSKIDTADAALAYGEGLHMGAFRFDAMRTNLKPHQKAKLKKADVALSDDAALKKAKKEQAGMEAIVEGNELARELVNLPANIANPSHMAAEAKKLAKLGVKVEILDHKKLEKLGMNLMMAVGRAAYDQPKLIVMRYEGAGKNAPTKAVVGKGVMFDTGGYNIKPTGSMEDMKGDMGGAAAVMGLMKAVAKRKSKVNVIGVCGCVLNMISGDAFLPSDIIKSYKGLTVEIGNTDAEGRLVLADALAYTIDKYKPAEIFDMATLTGAIVIALGSEYAGLFTEDDKIAENLKAAGDEVSERVWRMPVGGHYMSKLKSELADTSSTGNNRWAGAITAASFLQKFVGDTPWAHIDIAGVSLFDGGASDLKLQGANGFGTRLMLNYLERTAK